MRRLLEDDWSVRALTRSPAGRRAKALAEIGAKVVAADMNDESALRGVFDGADAVYSVQNGMASGFGAEVAQGRNVAQAAKAAGVAHVVYASAGPGQPGTGVPSWDSKLLVEDRLRELDVPSTILRPMAFMELMTEPSFYPSVGTWRIWPKLTGEDRPIPWVAVEDLASIAVIAFGDRERWLGRELRLAADMRSLGECRAVYRDVMGGVPRTVPMPTWLFDRFTRKDATTMWRWLRTNTVDTDLDVTKQILPTALTVPEWLSRKAAAAAARVR